MFLLKKIFLFLICFFIIFGNSFADNNEIKISNINEEKIQDERNNDLNEYIKIIEAKLNNKKLDKKLKIGDDIKYDFTEIKNILYKKFGITIEFEWSTKGNVTKKGPIFTSKFLNFGKKEINLNIHRIKKDNKEKEFILNKKIYIFVYKTKMPIIFDINLGEEKITNYIKKSIEAGVYINNDFIVDLDKNNKINLLEKINTNFKLNAKKGNYITVWGDKNFIFTIIGKINKELLISGNILKTNLVLVSPYNTDVLNNYLRNFLSNKKWIEDIILIPDSSLSQLRLNSTNIDKLEKSLNNREYENLKVNTEEKISHSLFISKFVNTLSNNGFSTSSIFLILIIPFLFTGISVFKHFIGLSPIGTIIPIFITLLLFIIGIFQTMIVLFILIVFNLLISKLVNKYTLLYTPKISFILIMNLAVLMFGINLFFDYNLINFNISDVTFIVLFIVIAERLITLVISKEFNEYKYNLLNTIIFALVLFGVLSFSLVSTFILAYPEIILILIPLNFLIGRFTGLRITEYFRFREVIKSIEE